jgi:hypothetical protein
MINGVLISMLFTSFVIEEKEKERTGKSMLME